jgi:hypothetical protein
MVKMLGSATTTLGLIAALNVGCALAADAYGAETPITDTIPNPSLNGGPISTCTRINPGNVLTCNEDGDPKLAAKYACTALSPPGTHYTDATDWEDAPRGVVAFVLESSDGYDPNRDYLTSVMPHGHWTFRTGGSTHVFTSLTCAGTTMNYVTPAPIDRSIQLHSVPYRE